MSLEGKNILLGVTGGIAAYKAANLTRLLVKEGASVKVVMTPAAKQFVTPLTFATLSQNPVLTEFFNPENGEWHSHVKLGVWADAMIVAPATANTIAKMANGIADNLLTTSYLSMRGKVFVAPAMDLDMYAHPTTQRNIEALKAIGNIIIEAETGELASGLNGKGRMAEPETIVKALTDYFESDKPLQGHTVLVTAGPTYEKIDPVRFIGNYSSGKMGFALAEAAAEAGANVVLVAGPTKLTTSNRLIKRIDVESAQQMYDACTQQFGNCDAAIMAAAVADYRPAAVAGQKIKKGNEPMTITLESTPDIAASLGKMKRPGQVLVGFALETENGVANAQNKLKNKNLDFVVLNSANEKDAGFCCDTNRVTIIKNDGQQIDYQTKDKHAVARDIISQLLPLLNNKMQ
ncbi:MAG: bifunctional phosphopantothenoylcysteine decarboxylase/phosphopantothenate--cysteine ligase CoaBC [Salinivirgaceae bacterium]|nr:bifunctional phosphopantothenoylcysteine decarboxylase/phosphopantothenate--cysteine ligase CoaBC [Salinivirgaceae bacterium]